MHGEPASVAAQFRVAREGTDVILVDRDDPQDTFSVRPTALFVGIVGVPATFGHSYLPDHSPWVILRVEDAGASAVFVINEPDLSFAELAEIRIVTIDDYKRHHDENAADQPAGFESPSERTSAGPEFPASMGHLAGDSIESGPWEWLGITIGLPASQVEGLIQACIAGREQRVFVGGYLRAHTASYFYCERPVMLFANQSVELEIDDLTISEAVEPADQDSSSANTA